MCVWSALALTSVRATIKRLRQRAVRPSAFEKRQVAYFTTACSTQRPDKSPQTVHGEQTLSRVLGSIASDG